MWVLEDKRKLRKGAVMIFLYPICAFSNLFAIFAGNLYKKSKNIVHYWQDEGPVNYNSTFIFYCILLMLLSVHCFYPYISLFKVYIHYMGFIVLGHLTIINRDIAF